MTWFEKLTGITDENPARVYECLSVDRGSLVSNLNGWRARIGTLTLPSLGELKAAIPVVQNRPLTLKEVIADVQQLHMQPENEGALFQVASQFNLLEMVHPAITPEMGVGRYENDLTQGPACALACLAGTIYRNYFVPIGGGIGQTSDRQINCLSDLSRLLGSTDQFVWEMRNGYALPTPDSLHAVNKQLATMDVDRLRAALRIGVQANTQVTTNDAGRLVTQVYCSAMPVAYSNVDADLWSPIAKLVLEAAYEATLLAAIQNRATTGNNRVFLTMLGGGAFGNRSEWISDAIKRALRIHSDTGLDVRLVSYGKSSALVQRINAERYNRTM